MEKPCPYYKGTKKDGKKTFLLCGEHTSIQIGGEDTLDDAIAAGQDVCLNRAGQSHVDCRAFLMTSIQGKQINVNSNHSIPELQDIYRRVLEWPGCGDCEHYWRSAGYGNAAPYPGSGYEAWKE